MLTAFLVLVYFTRSDIGGPAGMMTMVVFTLTLLLMVRQSLVLRGDALIREKRAARMLKIDSHRSSQRLDVIMIVEPDGVLRFISPACEERWVQTDEVVGKNLLDVWGRCGQRPPAGASHEIASSSVALSARWSWKSSAGRTARTRECRQHLTADQPCKALRSTSGTSVSARRSKSSCANWPFTILDAVGQSHSVQGSCAARPDTDATRPLHRGVLFLDLDNFKTIMTHGSRRRRSPVAGRRPTNREETRASDTVARLGGDDSPFFSNGSRALTKSSSRCVID